MAAIVYQTNKKRPGSPMRTSRFRSGIKRNSSLGQNVNAQVRQIPKHRRLFQSEKKKKLAVEVKAKRGPVPITRAARSFYGATYLFDKIGEETGVTEDLRNCFSDSYRKILSITYYLILEAKKSAECFPHWAALHRHPSGEVIASQRSSGLFASISEDARQRFFQLQGKRRVEKEYLAYDSTSISSYSKHLRQVRYGRNKDHEHLAQINLTLLVGQ